MASLACSFARRDATHAWSREARSTTHKLLRWSFIGGLSHTLFRVCKNCSTFTDTVAGKGAGAGPGVFLFSLSLWRAIGRGRD